MSGWINTKDRLPEFGKYVLIIGKGRNWHDTTDQEHVNCKVMKLVRDKVEFNNERDYLWQSFGGDCEFGHSVDWWHPIPELPVYMGIDLATQPDKTFIPGRGLVDNDKS